MAAGRQNLLVGVAGHLRTDISSGATTFRVVTDEGTWPAEFPFYLGIGDSQNPEQPPGGPPPAGYEIARVDGIAGDVFTVARGQAGTIAAAHAADAPVTLGLNRADVARLLARLEQAGGGSGTPSNTVETETTFGQASAAGGLTSYSRGDHTHGTPAAPGGTTPADTVVAETAYGQASAVGVGAEYAREDHSHGTPAVPAHSALTGVTADQHHTEAHDLTSAAHTDAGLTAGHVLRATGAAAFSFGQAGHGDLGGVTADQHHAQAHAIGGADHTGQLDHGALSGLADDDHTQYATNTELTAHEGNVTAHHARTKQTVTFSKAGALTVQTGTLRWYANRAITLVSVRASVGTAPTGASLIVDVNKGGTTIFTTQSNRPTIAVSTNTDLADALEVTALAQGDYLTVDIDQIGSTVAGSDLTVEIEYTED